MKARRFIKRRRNGTQPNHVPEPVPAQQPFDEPQATDDQARQYGWDQASQLGARLPALRPALEDFARRLRQSITPSRRQQIQEQVAEAKEQEAILIRRNDTIRDTLVPKREDEIEELKTDNDKIRAGRRSTKGSVDWLDYGILGGILVFVTIYLVLFYASASFSAYLWNPQVELQEQLRTGAVNVSGVLSGVFKANAFLLVRRQGLSGVFFILLMSGVFIGFGYLLHKLMEARRRIAVACLATAVLVYDGILAYMISEKIHQMTFLAGLVKDSWEWTMVFTDGRFYAVLFGGWLVCIGWGILLFFFMEERKKLHPVRMNNEHIERLKNEINGFRAEVEANQSEAAAHEIRIKRKQREMEGQVLEWDWVKGKVNAFALGWMRHIEASNVNAEARMTDVDVAVKLFLKEHRRGFSIHTDAT